jgi:hypothetical protein
MVMRRKGKRKRGKGMSMSGYIDECVETTVCEKVNVEIFRWSGFRGKTVFPEESRGMRQE